MSTLAENVFAVISEKKPLFEGSLQLDTPLGHNGLDLDSLSILEILLELEDRTGIRLRNETLTAEALATPGGLIRYMEQLLIQ